MSAFGQNQTFVGSSIFDRLLVWHTRWQHWAVSRRSNPHSPPMLWPTLLRDPLNPSTIMPGHLLRSTAALTFIFRDPEGLNVVNNLSHFGIGHPLRSLVMQTTDNMRPVHFHRVIRVQMNGNTLL